MAYALADIDPKTFSKLDIDQDWMLREFNQKLIPRQVYDTIKHRSKDFTEEDPLLLEADQLLKQLLDQAEIGTSSKKKGPSSKPQPLPVDEATRVRVKARARKRLVQVLKLKRQREKMKDAA